MQRCTTTTRSILAILLFALGGAIPADAATVRRLELDEIRARAESVFSGQVVGVSARLAADGKMVWTDYEIAVSDTIAGRDPGASTVVSFAGGTVPELSIGVPGMPALREGDHYVFFIEPRPDSAGPALMPTVGWGQGLYRILRIEDASGARTALVSADGEPLEVSSDGRLMRGPLVSIAQDRIVEPAPALRDDTGTRMRPTRFEAPDGTVTMLTASPEVATPVSPPARSFATVDDLRLFVQGRLGSVPSRNR